MNFKEILLLQMQICREKCYTPETKNRNICNGMLQNYVGRHKILNNIKRVLKIYTTIRRTFLVNITLTIKSLLIIPINVVTLKIMKIKF